MQYGNNNHNCTCNVRLFLTLNTDSINEEDRNCMTILMHVMLADEFNAKLAKRLIKRGADVNHIDKNGNPLLI